MKQPGKQDKGKYCLKDESKEGSTLSS